MTTTTNLHNCFNSGTIDLTNVPIDNANIDEITDLIEMHNEPVSSLCLDNTGITPAIIKHLADTSLGGTVIELVLSNNPLTKDCLRLLGGFRKLSRLGLANASATDDWLDALENLADLTELDLGGNPNVTNIGLARLSSLKNLRGLGLGNTGIVGDALAELVGLPIELLNLSANLVNDRTVARLPDFPNISELRLAGTSITDGALPTLSKLATLNHLSIARCCITTAGLLAWKPPGTIQTLDLYLLGESVNDAVLAALVPQLAKLISLGLRKTDITNHFLEVLADKLVHLQNLDVSATFANGQGLKYLLNKCDLQRLGLALTNTSGIDLQNYIAAFPSLEALDLSSCHHFDADAIERAIPRLQKLLEMDLSSANITIAVLKAISELPKLQWLNLGYVSNLSPKDLLVLGSSTSLEKVLVRPELVTDALREEMAAVNPRLILQNDPAYDVVIISDGTYFERFDGDEDFEGADDIEGDDDFEDGNLVDDEFPEDQFGFPVEFGDEDSLEGEEALDDK